MKRTLSRVLGGIGLAAGITLVALEPQPPRGEWRFYGGDAASTKYSPLDQITRANVKQLEIAWRWSSPDNPIVKANPLARPGGYEDTPLMINGIVYTATSLGQYAAIDAGTGETRWLFDPGTWKLGRPPNLGFTHRGMAYWTDGRHERLLVGTHDAHVISIDAKTGALDPAFGDRGRVDVMGDLPNAQRMVNYAINSSPVIVRNVVILGANVADNPLRKEAPRGDVSGFDVRSGKRLWTFHSIPQAGEFGHDSWAGDSSVYTGGVNVWSMMSGDEALGYVYLPFGTPTNDYYGGHRLGDNLFAESLVCLDATTGKRVWHFQGVHHGLWDYDFPAAPILANLMVGGRSIKAVVQVSKQGFVYVLDRLTGKPVWPIEERPVPGSSVPGERTSPTQPFPTKPPAFDRQGFTESDVIDYTPEIKAQALDIVRQYQMGPLFTPPSAQGTVVVPGHGGGANYGGASFDPETGRLYVPSMTSPIVARLVPPDPSRSNLLYRHTQTKMALPTIDGLLLVKPPYSRVTAYELNKGEIAWQVPLGDGPRNHPLLKDLNLGPLGSDGKGHPLLTKTLLFVSLSRPGGRAGEQPVPLGNRPLSTLTPEVPKFRAFDKKSGALVWEFVLPKQPAATPMTYEYRGRQYVVLAIGNGDDAELIAFALKAS